MAQPTKMPLAPAFAPVTFLRAIVTRPFTVQETQKPWSSLRKHIHWGYLTPHETRLRYRQDQALAA